MAKLTQPQQWELASMLATWCSNNDIQKHFKETYELTVYDGQLFYYRHSGPWPERIEEMRAQHLKDLSGEFLAHKKNRLQKLLDVIEKALKPAFAGQTKFGRAIYKINPGPAVQAIEAARKEIEGDRLTLDGSLTLAEAIKKATQEEEAEAKQQEVAPDSGD